MREIREPGIILLIQNDAQKAFALKTDDFDTTMVVDNLKLIFEKNGIIYGLADDDSLDNFIKKQPKEEMFEIAKGLGPINGTDAQIVCMFEKNFLQAGKMGDDGTIDFKNRGDIPFVKKEDVLAEKRPPKEGKDGLNIYGEAIVHVQAEDISFVLGQNVSSSENGLLVTAAKDGNPKLATTGEISVNDSYFIEGDVDYSTGHIKFDKNIYITGTVKNGFSVEGIDVVVDSVRGGIIKAKGDVFIQNGATKSSVKANGNINAGFIHSSHTSCLGNMHIAKEIRDTRALIEGTFEMNKGRIFSSSIFAKGGAKIYNIGSQKAKPSSLTVGKSTYIEEELLNIEKNIENNQILLEKTTIKKNKLSDQLNAFIEKLNQFDMSRQRTCSMMEEMKKNSKENPDNKIDLFQKNLDEAQKKIHDLKDEQAIVEAKHRKTKINVETYAQNVTAAVKEKFAFNRFAKSTVAKPVLEISGKAFAGTKVEGEYAKLVLGQDVTRSRIMEIQTGNDSDHKNGNEMIITSL